MCAFSYAWSLSVAWQRWRSHHSIGHSRKPHVTRKLHGSMLYRAGVIADRSFFTLGNRDCGLVLLLLPWPWPDDLHIRTRPLFSGAMPDERKWTSYVKAFQSYCLTDSDRPTDRRDAVEIIYHAASRVVNESFSIQLFAFEELNAHWLFFVISQWLSVIDYERPPVSLFTRLAISPCQIITMTIRAKWIIITITYYRLLRNYYY